MMSNEADIQLKSTEVALAPQPAALPVVPDEGTYVPASARMRRSGPEGVTVREAIETWHDGLSPNTRRAYVRDILAMGEWLEIPQAEAVCQHRTKTRPFPGVKVGH